METATEMATATATVTAMETGDGDGDGDETLDAGIPVPDHATSTRAKLVWKRTRTLENDLTGALALTESTLCNEMDLFHCTRHVHLVALGGNEPFRKALYTPLADPSVTTSVAVDRLVLAACSNAVERDRTGPALVFTALDLDAASVDAESAEVTTTITELYRRLHARNPTVGEITEVKTLAVDDSGASVSAEDFAKLSCFAIGTTTEFVFY